MRKQLKTTSKCMSEWSTYINLVYIYTHTLHTYIHTYIHTHENSHSSTANGGQTSCSGAHGRNHNVLEQSFAGHGLGLISKVCVVIACYVCLMFM